MPFPLAPVPLSLWRLRGPPRRPLSVFLPRRRPLLPRLRRRPLRLWPRLLPLGAPARLRRRGLLNRLLPHSLNSLLTLLLPRSHLLLPLRGLLRALRGGLTVRLPLGLYLLLHRG